MHRRLSLLCGCIWASAFLACTEAPAAGNGPACVAGASAACTCGDGAAGVRTCNDRGTFDACDCTVEPFEPDLTCEPGTLDFGRVVVGREQVLEVTCRNRASAGDTLVVAPIAGEDRALFGHDREVEGGAVTVPAGGKLTVAVTYRAARGGQARATLELLRVARDGTHTSAARIELRGQGLTGAVRCAPSALDFGFVAPGMEKHREVVCWNESEAPFEITGVALDAASDRRFTWRPTEYPIVIPAAQGVPGELHIDVAFMPTIDDAGYRKNGILTLTSNDSTMSRFDVQLTGFVGGPVLSCSPGQIDFGLVATSLPATRSFVCANVGSDDPTRVDDALVVTGIESTDPEFEARVHGELNPAGYRVGETFTVDVTYRPDDDGVDGASIQLLSNDTVTNPAAPRSVEVQGLGRDLPPCDFELAPADLRFGIVEKDRAATLEVAVRNHRADAECVIRDLRLSPGCDAAFSLPAGPVELEVLPPAGELRIPLQFLPTAHRAAPYTCEVLFDISNPADPHQVVQARGASTESCAFFAPPDLDFGTVKPGCAADDRQIVIFNMCPEPLVPADIVMAGGGSGEFFVRSAPVPDSTISPGLPMVFRVAYRPVDEGNDHGGVLVSFVGEAEPHLVTLRGRAALDAVQTDTFEQGHGPVDVLWVMDNSGGLSTPQAGVATNAAAFLQFAQEQAIDFQIGVTTSGLNSPCGNPGGAGGAEDGRLFPVDNSRPRILKPTTPDLEAVWAANFHVGTCHYDEFFMEAAYRALTPPVIDHCDDPRHPEPNDGNCGFLRKDADLSIIAVADENDNSPRLEEFYLNTFLALKGFQADRFRFHAITGARGTGCSANGGSEAGDRLIDLAEATEGGSFHSICSGDWDGTMRDVSKAAFGYRSCFSLKGRPEDTNGNGSVSDVEGELQIRVDGLVSPSTGPQGQARWSYGADRKAVCYEPDFVPEPGRQVEISYRPASSCW